MKCFECYKGEYETIVRDFVVDPSNPASIVVPDVEMIKCPVCGDIEFSRKSWKYIDAYIAWSKATIAEVMKLIESKEIKVDVNEGWAAHSDFDLYNKIDDYENTCAA